MAGSRRSLWRLPWKPLTGTLLMAMTELGGTWNLGDDPISGVIMLLLLIPFLIVLALWLVEMAVELVLWPFFVAGRAIARGAG